MYDPYIEKCFLTVIPKSSHRNVIVGCNDLSFNCDINIAENKLRASFPIVQPIN